MTLDQFLSQLETKCPRCDAKGGHWYVDDYGMTPCEPCCGSGYRLTDEGKAFMEFLSRHSKSLPFKRKKNP